MAATYDAISREDWEDYLDSSWGRGKWNLSPRHMGVYILHLSKNVGIYISTSIGGRDLARSVGKGAMHFKMISRITGQPLATKKLKQAIGKTRWNRAGNWRKTIASDLEKIRRYYQKMADFFERIADPREEDYSEILETIESIPNWDEFDILKSFRDQVKRGRSLSPKQMAIVERIQEQQKRRRPWRPSPHEKEDYLARMRDLWRKVDPQKREYINEMGQLLKDRGQLPSEEKTHLDLGMEKHRV